jgi:hypothetical protein
VVCVKGDRFKHKIDGKFCKVKTIKNETVILEWEDTPARWWVGDGNGLTFGEDRKEKKAETKNLRG